MTTTQTSNTPRATAEQDNNFTSTIVVDQTVAASPDIPALRPEEVDSGASTEVFYTIALPGTPERATEVAPQKTSPFHGYSEELRAFITEHASGELVSRNQFARLLSFHGCINQVSNGLAVNIKDMTNALMHQTECSRDEAIRFCSEVLTHYDIRSVALSITDRSDLELLAAMPLKPTALHIEVKSPTILAAKSGTHTDVVLNLVGSTIDLSQLTSFSLGASTHLQNSKEYINAAPLIEKLSEAPLLSSLHLALCDLTGASSATMLKALDVLKLNTCKCTVADLKPLIRASVVDLTGTDIGEPRTVFGLFARGKLGEDLASHFTSKESRVTQLTLPALMFNTNISFLDKFKAGGVHPNLLELNTVNSSGAHESGNHREVLMAREKNFPHLPSPNNGLYEKVARGMSKKA